MINYFFWLLAIIPKTTATIPAPKNAITKPIIDSLPIPFPPELDDVESSTHAPFLRTVPGPHLSSNTHAPFLRTVPGPHCVAEVLSAAASAAALATAASAAALATAASAAALATAASAAALAASAAALLHRLR